MPAPNATLPAAEPAAPGPAGPAGPTPVVAELRELCKTYFKPDGTVMCEALRGLDLSIRRGEAVAIMGASGSGKSTLMNILGCLDRPTRGDYLVDGRSISSMDDEELSRFRGRTIGFVFQAFNLIPQLTVEQNVEVPLFYQGVSPASRRQRAEECLRRVGLGDRLGHRPSELSGGQQQRVAIARALVTDPVVLMADEPTGNLDSATGASILNLLMDFHAAGMTLIVVTHDDKVAARCQRIVRLRDGVVEWDRRVGA